MTELIKKDKVLRIIEDHNRMDCMTVSAYQHIREQIDDLPTLSVADPYELGMTTNKECKS